MRQLICWRDGVQKDFKSFRRFYAIGDVYFYTSPGYIFLCHLADMDFNIDLKQKKKLFLIMESSF